MDFFFALLLLRVGVVCMCLCMCVSRCVLVLVWRQKWTLCVLLYHSYVTFRDRLSRWTWGSLTDLARLAHELWRTHVLSVPPVLGLQTYATTAYICVDLGYLNLGPHVCFRGLATELLPQFVIVIFTAYLNTPITKIPKIPFHEGFLTVPAPTHRLCPSFIFHNIS